jgi:ribosomal protein L11 methylase PrmA
VSWTIVDASFRDPSGFVYTRDGTLYRQVNEGFRDEFLAFLDSGLYDELARDGLLVPHETADPACAATPDAAVVLRPRRVPFISYPYEWCFSQLKDAALLTLDAQERALKRGFVLRDASAYNAQFLDGRPVLIDTLSFERNVEGRPWQAYRQFCEHFLVPLVLMSRIDVRCGSLLRDHLEGVPLELGSALLPRRSWASFGLLLHVHMHARAKKKYEDAKVEAVARGRSISSSALSGLVASLRATVTRLEYEPSGTQWADYLTDHNYSEPALRAKEHIVAAFLDRLRPRSVWDAGANTGEYSRLAARTAEHVVSLDVDPAAVERNYRRVRADGETRILPLLMDLTNPSPGQGWEHRERLSLEARGPADVVLALALVHHLAIGHNVPLPRVAAWFARLGRALVIEFVPKSDSQVARLLRSRADIFPDYAPDGFERAFAGFFEIRAREPVVESERTLYLMERREPAADRATGA